MKYSRRFLSVLLSVALLCLFSGSPSAAEDKLRISSWKLPFNVPVMLELDRGSYASAFRGMKVSDVNMQTGPKLMAVLAAGELDIVQGIGDAAFLVAVSGGIDAKVIAVNSRSPKAFAVVSYNPAVKKLSDLKGKRVAGLRGSVVHEVFIKAMSENGLSESDVEFFPMPVPQATAALLAKKVDAALLVGSEILRAQKAGARVLADGEGRVRGLSLVVAGTKFIKSHPDVVEQFLSMRRGTLSAMKSDPAAVAAVAAKETGLEVKDVSNMMNWYDFDCTVSADDRRSLVSTKKYLIDNKMIAGELDIYSLFVM